MTDRPILFSAAYRARGPEGFWARVDQSAGSDGCWPWLGPLNPKGYGRRFWQGKMTLSHRVAYLLSGKSIPDGFTIDHLCRNRACQNPLHLEAVPHRINLLRGHTIAARAAAAKFCPSGHQYDETSVRPNGKRKCRICDRARNARAYTRTSNRKARGWLSSTEKSDILNMIASGLSHSHIAENLGISIATVSRVRNGR